jgi:pyroglutamyl-peptidase
MLPRILITAFEPYDQWSKNSSWLALVEFTKHRRDDAMIVTRRYPVDFDQVRQRLEDDLAEGFDYALHLGQAPGSARVQLESVGLNVGGDLREPGCNYRTLIADGPVAYRSALPLASWIPDMQSAGIPTAVSYHAGTYLCNATLYLTHYIAEQRGYPTQAAFIHLPLDTNQVSTVKGEMVSLPCELVSRGIHLIVAALVKHAQLRDPELA